MYQGLQCVLATGVFYEVVYQWPGAAWGERWRVDRVCGYDRAEVGHYGSETEAEDAAVAFARIEAHPPAD